MQRNEVVSPSVLLARADHAGRLAAKTIPEELKLIAEEVGVGFSGGTPFGRYMRSTGKTRTEARGGLWMQIPASPTWSAFKRMAYAVAFAKCLREHGIVAYADTKSLARQ
jgi:hypothetical protein